MLLRSGWDHHDTHFHPAALNKRSRSKSAVVSSRPVLTYIRGVLSETMASTGIFVDVGIILQF